MAIRRVKTRIEQVSRAGRVRLFSNSWFNVELGIVLEEGRVYVMTLDDESRTISEVRELAHEKDLDSLEMLQDAEIERLRALLSVQREFLMQYTDLDDYDVWLATQAGKGRIPLPVYLKELEVIHNGT